MRGVDATLSNLLGVALRIAVAREAHRVTDLTPGEVAVWRSLGNAAARQDWLLGRAALKALAPGQDTSRLSFPHRALSLTHAGGLAVAVRTDVPQDGLGIDFEPWCNQPDPRTARFFLRPPERSVATGPRSLLRLWTIKEALHKAVPDNVGCVPLDLELADPAAPVGRAVGPRGERLRYAGLNLGPGYLAVAVCVAAGRSLREDARGVRGAVES
jgi:hypothetical protein